jgi:hypothetical protein
LQSHTPDGGVLAALAAARKAGAKLALDGDKIIAESPYGVPDEVVEQLRAHRPEILHILKWSDPQQAPFGARRPSGATRDQWEAALLGLYHFLEGGWGDRATALGWSHPELFSLPTLWSQIRLTGAAFLIGEWNVVAVDAEEVTVAPPWSPGSQLKFRRQDDLRQLAAIAVVEPVVGNMSESERDLVEAIVGYMADRVEVSATPDRLLAVMGRLAADDESALLDTVMMLADALFARGIELRFEPASGHVVLGHVWRGCSRRHTLIGGTTKEEGQ